MHAVIWWFPCCWLITLPWNIIRVVDIFAHLSSMKYIQVLRTVCLLRWCENMMLSSIIFMRYWSNQSIFSHGALSLRWSQSSYEKEPKRIAIKLTNFDHSLSDSCSTTRTCCDMMTSSNGSIFHVTCCLWGEFIGHRWIPLTKASDAERWCFLWSEPEQTVEQTIESKAILNILARRLHHFDTLELLSFCR